MQQANQRVSCTYKGVTLMSSRLLASVQHMQTTGRVHDVMHVLGPGISRH